ncbi:serine hydrolase domain-containing protein [Yinghuangia seranimata]|uniref:serine hydrolase domain-containing protein n=1 Tax=Yinghuangia seranimata TaxID=408067 RepID=UPI00248C4D7D|nr:serine hydrolase domain-containing protein [Yinghuangia seranimata]MDI2130867.1 serine hydrolase domain-containing protein [Yinghuangia seranimata]
MRAPSMMRRALAAGALALAALLPVSLPAQAGAAPRDVAEQLDTAIRQTMAEAGIPGVVVGLWRPGHRDYVRSFGVADTATGVPIDEDMYFRIGSETKTFTVTALLELVDDCLVGLDDPISKYVHGVRDGEHITLRQLAEMRSGLYSYTEDTDYAKTFLSDPGWQWTPAETLPYGMKHDNRFAPGAAFDYSNSNLVLLGMVIEKVTGRDVASVIRDRVLRPSHLGQTLFPAGAEFPAPHPHGYSNQTLDGQTADTTDWNPSWAWSAGAMISTLHDLRVWAKVLATGTLLSARTQAQRLDGLPTGFPDTTYGLGILDTHGWIGHNGSLPGYESVTVYLPEQDATLVVLLNTDSSHAGQEPSTLLGQAITKVVTPDHVYDGSATAKLLPITATGRSRSGPAGG